MEGDKRVVAAGEGDRHECGEGGAKAYIRGNFEEELIGPIGHEVFFREKLEAIGEGLEPAEFTADACGAQAILDAAGNLASIQMKRSCADRDQIHNEKDLDQRSQRISQPGPNGPDGIFNQKLGH